MYLILRCYFIKTPLVRPLKTHQCNKTQNGTTILLGLGTLPCFVTLPNMNPKF